MTIRFLKRNHISKLINYDADLNDPTLACLKNLEFFLTEVPISSVLRPEYSVRKIWIDRIQYKFI